MTIRFQPRQHGFTLVEAIVVMVITGILAGIMVLFIQRPVQNYVDSAARSDLSDAADLALRRMARELRTALPNSVRLVESGGVSYLEFIPTVSGGRYLAVEDNIQTVPALSFTDTNATTFSVVGFMPAMTAAPQPVNWVVVYNLGPGFSGADAYVSGAGTNRAGIIAAAAANRSITLDSNPFAVNGPANASPEQRFQVVSNPVTFRCVGAANGTGTLMRSVGQFAAVQPTPATGRLMANNVVSCRFSIGTLANQQAALIGLTLSLGRTGTAAQTNVIESVTLTHQIHVDNTP